MRLSRRQKLTIVGLVFYWPVVFILAHIPIPALVYSAQVSDKSLHFAAYLVLTFLLWFSISPDCRVDWRKSAVWRAAVLLILYALVDEALQAVVGRSCDVMDFAADVAGVLAGLVLFTFLTFWPSLLVVTGTTIFLLTNLARANVAELLPITSAVYYFGAYALLTLLWIQYMRLYSSLKAPDIKWLAGAFGVPIVFLLIVKLASVLLAKSFTWRGAAFAMGGITAVVMTFLVAALIGGTAQKASGDGFEGTV